MLTNASQYRATPNQLSSYNFARPHATLIKDAGGRPTTPAMAAGIERRVWTARDIAALLD
jgi:hypothetical protein